MVENYILMNKNTKVFDFAFDKDLQVIIKIEDVYNLDYAPLEVKNIIEEKRVIEFNNWFNNRGIPVYRDNVKEITEVFNVNSVKELTNKNYALSLSDEYWFCPKNSNITWEQVNYFENDYDSFKFADATYGNGSGASLKQVLSNNQDRTPNNTSNGQLKKVWIKRDGENYLYKGAGSIHNVEPINEVLASMVCRILDVPYVEYTLDVVHSKRQDTLVSVCKCAINKDEEIIPAYSILTEKRKETTKKVEDYYIYLEILKEHNVPKAEEYLQKMFMLDYIVLNEDRHLNNFGVIRDVNTLQWKRICPIFDTGRSMNTNVTTNYWDFEVGEVKCFTSEFVSSKELEKFFTIKISREQIKELKKLSKEYEEMLKKYREYTKLSDVEVSLLVEGYMKRVCVFEKINI